MTKQHLRLVAPTTEKRTVPPGGSEVTATTLPTRQPNSAYRTREHLTEAEVEKLIKAAGKNRWGHRDATMILVAFRHGLARQRAGGPALGSDRLRPRCPARPQGQEGHAGHPSDHRATRCARCAGCSASRSRSRRSCSRPSAARPSPRQALPGMWSALARPPGSASRLTRTCCGTPAASRWPTRATIRGRCRPTSATEHPAHGALHRAVAGSVQGLLEVSRDLSRKVRGIPQRVPSPGSGSQTHAATSNRGYGRLPCLARAE